jgi:hypothetical protein
MGNLNLPDPFELARKKSNEAKACEHRDKELRYLIAANDAKKFKYQCKRCGQTFQEVSQKQLSAESKESAAPIDDTLFKTHEKLSEKIFQDEFARIKAQNRATKLHYYQLYLTSNEWRKKREKVVARAKGICEGCLENPATQVHHLHYGTLFREMLFDLVAVCDKCHEQIHTDIEEFFELPDSNKVLAASQFITTLVSAQV